jgi:hypothetical protein
VKYLAILDDCRLETLFVLKELFKQTPQLSSLKIVPDVLISLFDDDELCKYLNKINKLNIVYCRHTSSFHSIDLNKFCEIFSNIEQLICTIDQSDAVLFLLKYLPKLSRMNIFSTTTYSVIQKEMLEEEIQKLDINIITNINIADYGELSISIFRDIFR